MPRRRWNHSEISAISGPKLAPVPSPTTNCMSESASTEPDSVESPKPAAITSAAPISARVMPSRSTARPMTRLPSAKPAMVSV